MTLAADTHNRASAYSESCKAAGTLVDDPACAGLRADILIAAADLLDPSMAPQNALDGALFARDATLLRQVFDRLPDATPWQHLLFRTQAAGAGTLAHEIRLDCLAALLERDLLLPENLKQLIREATSQDRDDALDWMHNTARWTEDFWPNRRLLKALLRCRPGCAAHMRADLDRRLAVATRSGTERKLFDAVSLGRDWIPLKVLAALLTARQDITGLLAPARHRMHPEIGALVDATASRHGQLSLAAREPDPVALVGRPERGVFFGINGETFFATHPPVET